MPSQPDDVARWIAGIGGAAAFLSLCVAATSLRFSRLTYRAGLPTLTVEGGWYDIIIPGEPAIGVFSITAYNTSRSETQITNVWLEVPPSI